jgi:uncharacterized phage-associated protein
MRYVARVTFRGGNYSMIITHYREKLINAIIFFAKNTQYCGKTKLMKLLYFLDFCHFKQTGKSVTGLDYFAWEMGPVPQALFVEISNRMQPDMAEAIQVVPIDKFQKIVAMKRFNGEFFTPREKRILENVSFIFKDVRADDMVEISHLPNAPWERTLREKGEWQEIDYLLALDDTTGSLSIDEAKERMEELAEMHRIFGVM